MTRTLLVVGLIAGLGAVAGDTCAASLHITGEHVTLDTGGLQGVSADGVVSFKGIPFAQPPTGELRWRAPQPPKRWSGVRKATARLHAGALCG